MEHSKDPRFERKNEEITKLMRDIGKILSNAMPKNYGFSLQIFSYGEGGDFFYISNAVREDMINMMKEFIQRNEFEAKKEQVFFKMKEGL